MLNKYGDKGRAYIDMRQSPKRVIFFRFCCCYTLHSMVLCTVIASDSEAIQNLVFSFQFSVFYLIASGFALAMTTHKTITCRVIFIYVETPNLGFRAFAHVDNHFRTSFANSDGVLPNCALNALVK
jgi:hypothetical protein